MSEKSLSYSDMAKPENHLSFHTYIVSPVQAFFYSHVLLSAFDNFKPRSPTANVSGFFTIPYLIALIFNVISLPLLYFHFTIIAALLILISSLLNFIAYFFDLLLFVWVFDLISIIPGIGSQNTGPGIYLATMSVSFLTVATILLCIGSCSTVRSTSNEQSIFD
ncbi:6581_t:CDS:2 [Dentiscutata erythropus]|uniref:6581_t:CDS:1 n=1 Tax=Dentiscutata erythropus TaxID=1348616 RepID=A0A9N8Z6I9_9GLOM|nr:6581_t:CDS:2 [Dentiscutata erythropus]